MLCLCNKTYELTLDGWEALLPCSFSVSCFDYVIWSGMLRYSLHQCVVVGLFADFLFLPIWTNISIAQCMFFIRIMGSSWRQFALLSGWNCSYLLTLHFIYVLNMWVLCSAHWAKCMLFMHQYVVAALNFSWPNDFRPVLSETENTGAVFVDCQLAGL